MKKLSVVLGTVLILSATAFGETLAQTDREKGIKYLEETRDGVVKATKGLSDAQMNFKSGPDRWSVAETLEHIATAEGYIFQSVSTQIMKAPAGPADRDTAKIDSMVLAMIPDRSRKAEAPAPLVPKGQSTPAETLDRFLKARARTIEFLKTTDGLRDHVADSPIGQKLDGYEWILFIAAHSDRHTKQILEVEADAGYPKK